MGASHQQAGARQASLNRLFSGIIAAALVSIAAWSVGNGQQPEQSAPSSNSVAPGPRERITRELADDPSGENAIDADTAWHLPPNGEMRGPGPGTPLYDNGPPLDDFGDPSSQASLQADGATSLWRFHAASADNFVLPVSPTSPGSGYQVSLIRAAFDFFQSGSASATPASTWTNGVYVVVYANSPLNQPAGAPALSAGNIIFTGNVVASTLVPNASLTNQVEINTGCRIVHQIDIPVNFLLAANTTYWLSVMPRHPAPPQSAWCLSSGTSGIALPGHRGASFGTAYWQVVEGNSAFGGCSTGGTVGAKKELSFQIFATEIQQDLGACCNSTTGQCTNVDRVANPTACTGPDEVFNPGTTCDLLTPACDEGACCYVDQFNQDSCIVTNQAGCDALNSHSFQLGLACTPDVDCTRPPLNDDCAQAQVINGNNVVVPFNTINASLDPSTPATPTCGQIEKDIWFNYTAGCDGTLVVTTFDSEFDTVLAVYNGPTPACPPCPTTNADFLACNDDNDLDPGSVYSFLAIPITLNDCVKIRVGGKSGANPEGGQGILRVFCIAAGQGACCHTDGTCTPEFQVNCTPPNRWFAAEPCGSPNTCLPNDSCPSPLSLPSVTPVSRAFNTSRATRTPDAQPTDCGSIEQDIWFSYVAPCTGELEINTDGSAYDTLITVYNFNGGLLCPDSTLCADLVNRDIACSDDQPGGNTLARVRIPAVTAGDCFVIRVGGHDNGFDLSGGAGVLNIVCIQPNEGACCFDDGSPCQFTTDVNCVAPNLFIQGQLCTPDICPTTPPNDLCGDAIALTGNPIAEPFDTTDATTDADAAETNCGAIVQDLWYTYVADCTGTVRIDTTGSGYDTALAVYGQTGVCPAVCPQPAPDGNSSEAVCNDDADGLVLTSSVILAVTQGDCLLIRVGGKDLAPNPNGGTGVLNIACTTETLGACCHADRTCNEAVTVNDCVALGDQFFAFSECNDANCPPFPPNDECAGAIPILDGPTPIDTTTASDSASLITPSPTCAQPTKDLWYRYEASCTGIAHLTFCSAANFDTVIAVYDDCVDCSNGAVQTVCDNNGCGPANTSDLFFSVTQTTCYLVRIGGVAGASGTGTLTISCAPSPGCCLGDVNLNGVVDLIDLNEFVTLLLEPITNTDPRFCAADVNGDGLFDGGDIQAFVTTILDGLPCASPVDGACCDASSCSVVSQDDCLASGGIYQGNFSDCTLDPCAQLAFGACCLSPSSCVETTIGSCVTQSGDFKGDGTICEVNTCNPPPPPVTCNHTEIGEFESSDPDPDGDGLGECVSLSATAFVAGAAAKNSSTGAAYVFRETAGVWVQEQKLTASNAATGDFFGESVAIDGDRILVGSPRSADNTNGSVYEYERIAGVWVEGQILLATIPQASRLFGTSVALNGATAFIGAVQDTNAGGSFAGAAFVFTHDGTNWTQTQKLIASDASAFDFFGTSVVVQGDWAVVGANLANVGVITPGAVYVFHRDAGVWAETQKLQASDGTTGSQFGWAVDIDNDLIVVGAYQATDSGVGSGAAYVFEFSGGTWLQTQKLLPSDGVTSDQFGSSVSIVGDSIAVGARRKNAVYVYARQDGSWQEKFKITSATEETGDQLGVGIDWDGQTLVAGANNGEVTTPASDVGTVHIFDLACDGACCIGGTCQMKLSDECDALGGIFNGVGVQCGPLSCPDPGACCVGDFSNNGVCDLADVADYVNAVLAAPTADPALCLADSDENGTVDGRDVAAFVNAVLAGATCP